MTQAMEHLEHSNQDIDQYHRLSDGAIPDTLSMPGKDKEAIEIAVERYAAAAVAQELALTLNAAKGHVSRVIQASSEIIFRTIIVPKTHAVNIVRTNYERSRVTLWVPNDVLTSVVSVAIGNDQTLQYDSSTLSVPSNGVLISNPQEFRTVRELWAIADNGDATSSYAVVCAVEEFVS
jgi:hypothetical protein